MENVSSLKEIIITHVLNKKDDTQPGKWKDSDYQLIHVEPIDGNKICAFVMKTNRLSNFKYEITVDIKFAEEDHKFKISHVELKPSNKTEYEWDIFVTVGDRIGGEPSSFKIDEEFRLRKEDYLDFHLIVDTGNFPSVQDIAPYRICRIGFVDPFN